MKRPPMHRLHLGEMMNRFQCVFVVVLVAVMPLVSACDKPVQSNGFSTMRDLVIQGDYDQAIGLLEERVSQSPAGPRASRAGLFLFKANFAKGDFDEAKKWCDWTIANHPNSLEAKKCEFKIGMIHLVQDQHQQALKCFQTIAESKDNPLRPEATSLVEYLKLKQGMDDKRPSGKVDPR